MPLLRWPTRATSALYKCIDVPRKQSWSVQIWLSSPYKCNASAYKQAAPCKYSCSFCKQGRSLKICTRAECKHTIFYDIKYSLALSGRFFSTQTCAFSTAINLFSVKTCVFSACASTLHLRKLFRIVQKYVKELHQGGVETAKIRRNTRKIFKFQLSSQARWSHDEVLWPLW
jgi:hypothetical protein